MSRRSIFHRRHLPHYQPEEATFHAVFRLAGSLPRSVIEELRFEADQLKREWKALDGVDGLKKRKNKIDRTYFERLDNLLDKSSTGPTWLRDPEIATIVQTAIHHFDDKKYQLFAYCIMSNHVHMVFYVGRISRSDVWVDGTGVPSDKHENVGRISRSDLPEDKAGVPAYIVSSILGSIKKYTARRANAVLGRRGPFWQDESYDRVIRDSTELQRTISYVINNPVKAGLVQTWEQWPWTYVRSDLL